ncbi:unnamed protein product [Leuciscus chuanchicus]
MTGSLKPRTQPEFVRNVQILSSFPQKIHLYNLGYGQLIIYRSFSTFDSRRTLRTTICYSNRIKANKFYAVSYLFLLVLLAGDVQLNPGPGLASASVGAPVDGAAGLLLRQRVEFPTLDDTGSISCILPGVLADFRSLSTGEDGAWRGDLNVQLCDVGGTAKRAERPTSAVEGLTGAGATVDGKLALASALNRSVNSAGWRRKTTVPDKMEFIKEEIEDMTDTEPSRIKHEDTEEQIDQVRVKEQRQELNEVEEEHRNFTIQRTKAKKTHMYFFRTTSGEVLSELGRAEAILKCDVKTRQTADWSERIVTIHCVIILRQTEYPE